MWESIVSARLITAHALVFPHAQVKGEDSRRRSLYAKHVPRLINRWPTRCMNGLDACAWGCRVWARASGLSEGSRALPPLGCLSSRSDERSKGGLVQEGCLSLIHTCADDHRSHEFSLRALNRESCRCSGWGHCA
jgi:hypothetical protein